MNSAFANFFKSCHIVCTFYSVLPGITASAQKCKLGTLVPCFLGKSGQTHSPLMTIIFFLNVCRLVPNSLHGTESGNSVTIVPC